MGLVSDDEDEDNSKDDDEEEEDHSAVYSIDKKPGVGACVCTGEAGDNGCSGRWRRVVE